MEEFEANQEKDNHDQAEDLNGPLFRLWLREIVLNWNFQV